MVFTQLRLSCPVISSLQMNTFFNAQKSKFRDFSHCEKGFSPKGPGWWKRGDPSDDSGPVNLCLVPKYEPVQAVSKAQNAGKM